MGEILSATPRLGVNKRVQPDQDGYGSPQTLLVTSVRKCGAEQTVFPQEPSIATLSRS